MPSKKYDAEKVLAAFATTLREVPDREQIRERLIAVVQATMQPAHISLWLCPPERRATEQAHRLEPEAAGPEPPGVDGTNQPREKQREMLSGGPPAGP